MISVEAELESSIFAFSAASVQALHGHHAGGRRAQALGQTLTRAKFEQLAHGLIQACLVPCQNALRDAGLEKNEIDEVILVGGSSRIPAVQQLVEDFFGKAPSKGVNPDEVVAVGAAIQGAILNKESGVSDIRAARCDPRFRWVSRRWAV